MGGKKLAEISDVYPVGDGELARITGVRVYVFAWKKEVSTLAIHRLGDQE